MLTTDQQVRRLRQLDARGTPAAVAAARSGMDPKTARKYRRLGRLPSEVRMPHSWRTHPDPFADVWTGVAQRLALNPGLEALTLFQQLQREHPGRFPDGQLRTFQRRVKVWRATDGPAQEVFFAQVHTPGRLCASDFTHMSDLRVTINGQPFDHLIYHFVLTYTNWETGTVCFAESFESLADGLQNALAELGGVPAVHRTDRLTAAIPPGTIGAEFTQRYRALLTHYGLEGQAIQAGHGNENGDIEQRHHRFKRALDQQLMLRASRDFASRDAYQDYLRDLFRQLNANREKKKTLERERLRALPARRFEAAGRIEAKVDAGSTIRVCGNVYSVSSRLGRCTATGGGFAALDGPGNNGGSAPDVLRAALHFVGSSARFTEALDRSLAFAGPSNYCPVVVGAVAGARWGASAVPALAHVEILPRVLAAADALAAGWAEAR